MNRQRLRNFLTNWLPLVLFCAALFIQSAFATPIQLPPTPGLDKLLHGAAYAVLGVLFIRAFGSTALSRSPIGLILASITAAALYGLTDEIHQYFVPARQADPRDLLADLIGATVGVLAYYLIRLKNRSKRPQFTD